MCSETMEDRAVTEEAWKEKCDYWNKGRIYGVPLDEQPTSNFRPGEYEIALNSINNK